jgi:hypothetical protein
MLLSIKRNLSTLPQTICESPLLTQILCTGCVVFWKGSFTLRVDHHHPLLRKRAALWEGSMLELVFSAWISRLFVIISTYPSPQEKQFAPHFSSLVRLGAAQAHAQIFRSSVPMFCAPGSVGISGELKVNSCWEASHGLTPARQALYHWATSPAQSHLYCASIVQFLPIPLLCLARCWVIPWDYMAPAQPHLLLIGQGSFL